MRSRRSQKILAVVLVVGFTALIASTTATLGWDGVVIWGWVIGLTILWVTIVVLVSGRSSLRLTREVSATHPGWAVLSAATTHDQDDAMDATGRRRVAGVPATLLYGPEGLELWARHKSGTAVRVLALPWAQIVDVVGTDVPNWRGVDERGLRITVTDGSRADLVISPTPGAVRAARATRTEWVVVVASEILARRTGAASPTS